MTGKGRYKDHVLRTPREIAAVKSVTQESSATNAKRGIMGSQHAVVSCLRCNSFGF